MITILTLATLKHLLTVLIRIEVVLVFHRYIKAE